MNRIPNTNPGQSLQRWLHTQLFDAIPCSIAVIDPQFRIIENNRNFIELFGDGHGKYCYEAYKGLSTKCSFCAAEQTFRDGQVRVNDETGVDKHGHTSYYIVHMFPIYASDNTIEYIIEMSIDITETKHLQKEYRMLFDHVPCYISVLNRDLRIVRANESACNTFGDMTGKHCYEVFKHTHTKCEPCPAEKTFQDNAIHKARQEGFSKDGKPTSYMVATSPLCYEDGITNHVIEIALDITEKEKLELKLAQALARLTALVDSSTDGIIVTNADGLITRWNPSASAISGYKREDVIGKSIPPDFLPQEFVTLSDGQEKPLILSETYIVSSSGEHIPVRFSGVVLRSGGKVIGRAAFFEDLRKLKELETQKINAERLAAVGQTVAGLAHSIRNILTGLEGGIYVVDSGLEKKQQERITLGWGMLHRNIDRISLLVKSLLEFAGGRTPNVELVDPIKITKEVVHLYHETAKQAGIKIVLDIPSGISPAPLDRESIHACLDNLMTNALDACQASEKPDCVIIVGCYEKDNCLIFQVTDEGCGMAYEVKQKIFTNFFTTKGTKGTGLGMLTIRKTTHEHGGKVVFETGEGKGSVFKLIFPRDTLPKLTGENSNGKKQNNDLLGVML
jgi:PAS domain S-box-containing protein